MPNNSAIAEPKRKKITDLAMQLILDLLQHGLEKIKKKCTDETNFCDSGLWIKFTGTGNWPAKFYLWHLSSQRRMQKNIIPVSKQLF